VDLGAIPPSNFTPPSSPFSESWQEHIAENGGMHLVETAVEAELVVDIRRALPVVPECPCPARDSFVRREQGSGVAEGAEVLGGVKAYGRSLSNGADTTAVGPGPDRLRAVLDDFEIELIPQCLQAVQVDAMPIEVDRDDKADATVEREELPTPIEVEQA
jgi:hypothetical protein